MAERQRLQNEQEQTRKLRKIPGEKEISNILSFGKRKAYAQNILQKTNNKTRKESVVI